MRYETIWTFKTRRFEIRFEVTDEDMNPSESFDYTDETELQDLYDKINSGRLVWFQAKVAVYLDGHTIGADYLGGCCYNSFEEFYTSHRKHKGGDYFTDMVREAIAAARKTLENVPTLRKTA